MSIQSNARDLVNDYVNKYGNRTEMTREEFLNWVHETYNNVSSVSNNLYPTDISFNRYNIGLSDFPGPNLCLVYVEERDKYRLVGSNYKYTGIIYQYKNKSKEKIVGQWIFGKCKMLKNNEDSSIPIEIIKRRGNLVYGIKNDLKDNTLDCVQDKRNVSIYFHGQLICGITVEDECYRIFNVSTEWKGKTPYLCDEDSDDTWFYHTDTIDECLGQIKRLVLFELKKNSKLNQIGSSELRKIITADKFKNAYIKFMEQADKNAITGKSQGSQIPEGFETKPECNGAEFSARYGHGNASAAPHMNWWVVSIYYLPNSGKIVMGIEEDRYLHLKSMSPIGYEMIGNKKMKVASFYSSTKDDVNYDELYDRFISTCEEVIALGMK